MTSKKFLALLDNPASYALSQQRMRQRKEGEEGDGPAGARGRADKSLRLLLLQACKNKCRP